MKSKLFLLLAGVLCLGMMGCEGDGGDSPAVVAETNAPVANESSSSSNDSVVGFGAPVAGNTVTGYWAGFCVGGGEKFALGLVLTQAGETVTGTYAWWPEHTGTPILSGSLSGTTFLLAVERNELLFSLEGQVDFAASTISGTWADEAGNSGTFSMREW